MTQIAEKEFKSSSLQVSGYLITKGVSLLRVDKHAGKTLFVFDNQGNIDELIREYFESEQSPIKFWEAVRSLKSRIYES